MVDIDTTGEEERTKESVAKVKASGLGKGSMTRFLEPGDTFKIADDDPNSVEVTALEPEIQKLEFSVEGAETTHNIPPELLDKLEVPEADNVNIRLDEDDRS